MSPLSYLILATLTLYSINKDYYVSTDSCIVIEDDIPSLFTHKNCIKKFQLLLARTTPFSVEIAPSNDILLSTIEAIINKENGYNYIGYFKNEGVTYRAVKSFTSRGLRHSESERDINTLTTTLAYCAWNIVDNFSLEKFYKPLILVYDILSCGDTDIVLQSIVFISAKGAVKGVLEEYQEIKTIKWTYYSPKQTDSNSTITVKQET